MAQMDRQTDGRTQYCIGGAAGLMSSQQLKLVLKFQDMVVPLGHFSRLLPRILEVIIRSFIAVTLRCKKTSCAVCVCVCVCVCVSVLVLQPSGQFGQQ